MPPSENKPFPLAFPPPEGPLFFLDEATLERGVDASRRSPRKRIIFPLHRTQDAAVQRMLNFMQPGTYAQPHLHPRPEAVENVAVLRGGIDFFRFDDAGRVLDRIPLRAGGAGMIDIEPRVWHTFATVVPDTVILEVKRGPYDAVHDKAFPAWCPVEGAPEAAAWLARLLETPLTFSIPSMAPSPV